MGWLLTVVFLVAMAGSAAAQQVDVRQAPAAPRPTIELEPDERPSGIGGATRPSDGDVYPRGATVPHDPTFVPGLSARRTTPTSTTRIGIAAWTSPNTPVGSPNTGWSDVSGWFGFGLAVTWGDPPPQPVKRQAN